MVSLGEDSNRSGAYFFDTSTENPLCNPDGEDLLDTTTLGSDDDPGFRRITSIPTIIVLLITTVSLALCVFILPEVYKDESPSALSIIVYLHSAIWFIIMLCDRHLRNAHATSRTYGYLDFYRKTRNIRRTPLMIFSGSNSALLVLLTVLHDYCATDGHCHNMGFTKVNFVQILVAGEMLVLLPVILIYLMWTIQFNRSRASPDVNQDDMMSTYVQLHSSNNDVGFRDDDFLEDVLEKQGDLIRYLKQHNAHLGRKILKLTSQLNER